MHIHNLKKMRKYQATTGHYIDSVEHESSTKLRILKVQTSSSIRKGKLRNIPIDPLNRQTKKFEKELVI